MARSIPRKELRAISKELRAQGYKMPKSMRCLVLPPDIAERVGGKVLCHGAYPRDLPVVHTDFWVK